MTPAAAGAPSPSARRGGLANLLLLLAAGIAQMLVVVDYTATAITLPSMARDFDVSADSLQWVITGYVLTFSIVLAIAGPLGDRYGRRRLLLLGIVLFGAASLVVGFGCSWGWSMSQAGGIATVPEGNVGLASGSMLTVLIMSGNVGVVVSAAMIDAEGGAAMTDYGPGIAASYLLALGLAAAFLMTWLVVPTHHHPNRA